MNGPEASSREAPFRAEVVVVGGGPAGSATAAHLAALGHEVVLLERGTFPQQKPCGEYYSPGVVDALGRLGVIKRVLSYEHDRPSGMRIVAGGSSVLLDYPAANGVLIGETNGASGNPRRALGIRRYHLDRALVDHARSLGVRVLEGTRVTGLLRDPDGRVSGVEFGSRGGSSGVEGRISARFVVGADGRHSVVSRLLGLDLPVRRPRRLGLHAHFELLREGHPVERATAVEDTDKHAPGEGGLPCDLEHGLGEMHVGENGAYCGLGPVGGGLVVAGLVSPLGHKCRGESIPDYFDRRLADVPGAARSLRGARRVSPILGVGPLARRVSRSSGPGYLLVGDAAGYLDPFTGEGVFRALRGAELAAAAVERSLRPGGASPDPQGSYERARREVFSEKERLTRLVQFLLSHPPLMGYALSRLARRESRATEFKAALGDYGDAREVLRPGKLAPLLAP